MTVIPNIPVLPMAEASEPALSSAHIQAITAARRAAKPVRRCATIASISGWTTGLFAIITLASSIGDAAAMMLGVGMCFTAYFELAGSRLLKSFDSRGARVLGWNQIVFGVMLVSYALWRMHAPPDQSAMLAQIGGGATGDPVVDEMLAGIQGDAGALLSNVMLLVYVVIAAVGVVVPGLTAVYYFTRRGHVEKLRRGLPAWVLDVMRAHG
jgi:hypothetical protein